MFGKLFAPTLLFLSKVQVLIYLNTNFKTSDFKLQNIFPINIFQIPIPSQYLIYQHKHIPCFYIRLFFFRPLTLLIPTKKQ